MQCVAHSVTLLTNIWISDDRECASILEPICSPLTEFLMTDTMPRGFINELVSRAALKPELFQKVNSKYLIVSNICF